MLPSISSYYIIFKKPLCKCLLLLLWLKILKITLFFIPINQDQFWGSNAKVCVTHPIHRNIAIIINDFQQKYVVLKPMRLL